MKKINEILKEAQRRNMGASESKRQQVTTENEPTPSPSTGPAKKAPKGTNKPIQPTYNVSKEEDEIQTESSYATKVSYV